MVVKLFLKHPVYMCVCIYIYPYSETSIMHFLLNLLRIRGLYMFRALLPHPQEALHKQYFVYCVHVIVS
jgi:hypothetical protein